MKCRGRNRQRGFTLLELVVALGIFLLIIGAAFTLLSTSQQRYRTESQVLNSFQEARLGMDQMVRDINAAGFPPFSFANVDPTKVTSAPFGWSPNYTVPLPCQVGINCFTPADFDIIIETQPNSPDPNCPGSVEWIRYQLPANSTTLMRGVVCKQPGAEPNVQTSQAGVMIPFVQNVVNNSPPGGAPVPLFQYACDTPSSSQNQPQSCPSLAATDNCPANIRDVLITLIVAAPFPDATTGQTHLVQLEGRGRRINPSINLNTNSNLCQ